jgi:hypothetical protein
LEHFRRSRPNRKNIVALLVHLRGWRPTFDCGMQESGMSLEWPFCDITTQSTMDGYRPTLNPRVQRSMRVSISFADLGSIFREHRAKRRFTANH